MLIVKMAFMNKCNALRNRRFFGKVLAFLKEYLCRFYSSTSRQESGRQFEEIAALALRRYAFDVSLCGGPKDRGVDFRGVWSLKSSSVNIIGQCKRYKKRLGPRHVRELEGTLAHETRGTLGVLVTESGYSKDAYEVFIGSSFPIAFTILKGFSDQLLGWCDQQSEDPYTTGEDYSSGCSQVDNLLHSTVNASWIDCHPVKIAGAPKKFSHTELSNVVNTKQGKNIKEEALPNGVQNNCPIHGSAPVSRYSKNWPMDVQLGNHYMTSEYSDFVTPVKSKSVSQIPEISSDSSLTRIKDQNSLETSGFETGITEKRTIHTCISNAEIGVFTMFELNPAARQLLPHLVIGIKYKRWKSKAPELCINESGAFINLFN